MSVIHTIHFSTFLAFASEFSVVDGLWWANLARCWRFGSARLVAYVEIPVKAKILWWVFRWFVKIWTSTRLWPWTFDHVKMWLSWCWGESQGMRKRVTEIVVFIILFCKVEFLFTITETVFRMSFRSGNINMKLVRTSSFLGNFLTQTFHSNFVHVIFQFIYVFNC